MKKLPFILLYSRLALAALNIYLVWLMPEKINLYISITILVALITDIFDGISARAMGISTEKMRALDSKIDTVFWLSVLFALFLLRADFVFSHLGLILILVATEAMCQIYAWIKFKRGLALRAYLAKAWAILIAVSCVEILCSENNLTFYLMFGWGLLSQFETMIIITLLPFWHSDVPSVWHAIRLRNNKPIRRHKLFNG